jgi:hypothetical protein
MLAEGRAARWNFIQPEFVQTLPQAEPVEAEPAASVREGQAFLLTGGRLSETAEAWAAGGLRAGIEYRYPLLDRRLVEFGLGLPPELFCQRGWPRYLYRYAMAGILPDRMRWRVDFGDKFVNLDRGRINRAFGDAVVWPLLERLLAEGHEWLALDSEAADQLMKQADRGHWAQMLGALRLEMLVNPAVWRAAESWLEAFDQVETDRNG